MLIAFLLSAAVLAGGGFFYWQTGEHLRVSRAYRADALEPVPHELLESARFEKMGNAGQADAYENGATLLRVALDEYSAWLMYWPRRGVRRPFAFHELPRMAAPKPPAWTSTADMPDYPRWGASEAEREHPVGARTVADSRERT